MTDVAVPGVAYARMEWFAWLADCPDPYCDNAMMLVPGQAVYRCEGRGACGTEGPIMWPPDPIAIETVLSMRPAMRNRCWLPGETIEDLLVENAAHHCLPVEWEQVTERTVLAETIDGVVVAGLLAEALPAGPQRRILTPGRR
jgi:hypothetical protein